LHVGGIFVRYTPRGAYEKLTVKTKPSKVRSCLGMTVEVSSIHVEVKILINEKDAGTLGPLRILAESRAVYF